MFPKDIASLIALHKLNALTPQQTLKLARWRDASPINDAAFNAALEDKNWADDLGVIDVIDAQAAFQKVTARIQTNRKRARLRLSYVAAAAVILIVCGFAFWLSQFSDATPVIQPGGNRAVLTFAGGATVELSAGQDEIVISDSLFYGDGSGVAGLNASAATAMIEISTPKGGEYRIVLSDETKVVLNAGSSIRFPKRFMGKERIVELQGEAYFEVSHKKIANQQAQPFVVKTATQTIQVLGTHFNVSAYADQTETQTTLVEGSVSVYAGYSAAKAVVLTPGQQAVNKEGEAIRVKAVDIYKYIAWTKNQFVFNAEPLSSVMQKVSRWYDLEYEFRKEGHMSETIEGILPRYASVQELLALLQESKNIRFKLEGRKIIIY